MIVDFRSLFLFTQYLIRYVRRASFYFRQLRVYFRFNKRTLRQVFFYEYQTMRFNV